MENTIIKLDYDGFRETDFLLKIVKGKRFVFAHFEILVEDLKVFRTNKGFHIYIRTNKPIEDAELVFIQLALGSDYARECFNWERVKTKHMGDKWNVLFKKKFAIETVQKEMVEEELKDISFELLRFFQSALK